MKYITKICLSCEQEFSVKYKNRNNNKGYCSSACSNKRFKLKDIICTCDECGKEFIRSGARVAKAERMALSGTFCSPKCVGISFGRNKRTNQAGTGFCKMCSASVGKRSTYCSNTCLWKDKNEAKISAWLSGEWDGTSSHGLSHILRRYVMEQNEYKCQECSWSKVHPVTGLIPLSIHHIDGNWKNNRPENIELLCPNCHSLTDTYGSLNKGTSPEGRSKNKRKVL